MPFDKKDDFPESLDSKDVGLVIAQGEHGKAVEMKNDIDAIAAKLPAPTPAHRLRFRQIRRELGVPPEE